LLVGRHPRLAAVPLMPGPGAQPGGSGVAWPVMGRPVWADPAKTLKRPFRRAGRRWIANGWFIT